MKWIIISISVILFIEVSPANGQFFGTSGDGFVMSSVDALSLSFAAMYSGGLADGIAMGSANNQNLGLVMARMQESLPDFLGNEDTLSEEMTGTALSVYPNPVARQFSLSGEELKEFEENVVVALYDMQGRKILDKEIRKNSKVYIPTIPSGLYILVVFDPVKSKSLKLRIEN